MKINLQKTRKTTLRTDAFLGYTTSISPETMRLLFIIASIISCSLAQTNSANNTKFLDNAINRFKKQLGRGVQKSKFFKNSKHPQEDRLKNRFIETLALEMVTGHQPASIQIMGRSASKPQRRNAMRSILLMFEEIWGYGCWCYFGEEYDRGHGPPQNEVDAQCQSLGLCYQCAEMDLLQEGRADCYPGMEEYNRPVRRDASVEGAVIACQEENQGDNCKIYTCACETAFINKLVQNFFKGLQFDPSKKHSLGFDPVVECPTRDGGGQEKQCCGEYPTRSPYGVNTRACCASSGKTYNPALYECCDDGTIKISC